MNGPQSTVANPAWFRGGDVNRPRIERARLHRRLLDGARAAAPGAAAERRAVVVTGPDAADRRSAVEQVLGAAAARYLHVNAERFAAELLPGSDAEQGPTAAAEEANALAERLRDAAVREGINVVVDTTFADSDQAVTVGRQFADAGYRIDVVEVQTEAPGADALSVEGAAQRLASEVGAVTAYRRFSVETSGVLKLDTDRARASLGGPLVDAGAARAAATARVATPHRVQPRRADNGRGG